MKLDAESSVDCTDHASKVIAESNEHFSSDLMNLDDEAGKTEQDFRSPTIEGKPCHPTDLSQSHTRGRSDPLNHKNESGCRDAPFPNATSEISSIAKEDPFYMDKTVTEVELLLLSVPTRNGASPVVKDICIDEGEQPFEKILVEYDKVDKDISFNSNLPRVNGRSALVEEMTEDDRCPDLKLSSINGGLDSFGKILEGNVGDNEFSIPDTHALYLNGKTDAHEMYLNEKTDTHAMCLNEKTDKTVMNDMKYLLVNGCPIEQCCPCNSVIEGGKLDATDIAADKVLPSDKITEHRSHLLQKFYSEFPQVDLCGHNYRTGENQDLRRNFHQDTEEETNFTFMGSSSSEKAHESRQILETVSGSTDVFEEGSTPSFSVASSSTTLNRIHNIKEASDDFKLHDEVSNSGLVTEDASIVGNESRVMNNQQTMKAQNCVGTEEPIIVGESSALSSFTHINHGDSSLPGPSCLSVPVTTSGHIPYSGSLSLRSDSSTTSAHSFAFPIMQSEWNSSPVKMAKADRRRMRKHRWRTVLVCCKF